MKSFTKKSLYIIAFSVFFIAPGLISAQSVSLTASKTSYTTADSILVTASIQTGGQQINTVGGQVSFLPTSLSVSDVRFGNSIISLWVDKPTANNSLGTINFTGGVPGGFSGSSGQLFTFVVKPKKEGSITITLKDVKVLLNDGSGSELQGLKIIPLNLSITKTTIPTPPPITPTSIEENSTAPKDKVSPENFVPMVSRHESIADNAYFVSFFAVDKDSGVVKYEVREVPKLIGVSTEWVPAKSPHILSIQSWGTLVEVRATDGAGNSTVSTTYKPFNTTIAVIFVIIIVLVTVVLTRVITKKSGRFRRK